WVCSEPLLIGDGLVNSWKAGDFSESSCQVVPCKVVRRDLEIFTGRLLRVVENVAGEMAEVWQGDDRDMSLTERCCEDARAIVENPGQEVATEQHFGVRPVGENGPLEGISLRGEGLGREPVADSPFAIVVPAVGFRTVTSFL